MKRDFAALATRQFDLLVCGGGIYGAWTAYDAALRGLRVAIVEQGDWACATSSASSKLIHGGLRYLESFDFKLVKKALAERRMLLAMAPHRVWPLRFGVPVYAASRIGTWRLKAGLTLYDFLADDPAVNMKHRYFNRAAFAQRFSLLDGVGLKGGFTYADAQTDDARLVLELISGALAAGAVCVNYCKLTGFKEVDGVVCGATVHDQLHHTNIQIDARKIVNATGQWIAESKPGKAWCRLSKGVHLILPAVLKDEALLLTAQSDGRVFFMIPWYGMTLLGTTDTDYRGSLDRVTVEEAEVSYLLNEANHYLKTAWTAKEVIGRYAGVRVLQHSEHETPSAVSRDWELKTTENGLLYSVGGKITSAREDAACIVDAVCAQLGVNLPRATGMRPFPWTPEKKYAEWSDDIRSQARQFNLDQDCTEWLMRRHGRQATAILGSIADDPDLGQRVTADLPFLYADLLWSARYEMVTCLEDLLRRRMPVLILARLTDTTLRYIAEMVAPVMGWDHAAIEREVASCHVS